MKDKPDRLKICARCGAASAERTWDMRPCAVGSKTMYRLCDDCDLELNRLVLSFFHVANASDLLAAYQRKTVLCR